MAQQYVQQPMMNPMMQPAAQPQYYQQPQVPAAPAPAVNYNPQPQGGTNMYNFIQNPAPQYYPQPGMMQPAAQPQYYNQPTMAQQYVQQPMMNPMMQPAAQPQLVVQPGAYNVNPGMPATAPQYYPQQPSSSCISRSSAIFSS